MRGEYANYRHSFNAWFPGMENPWKQYDTEENRKEYEKEQRQRAMERKIRKTKREVMGYREAMEDAKDESLREDLATDYKKKALQLQQQNAAYNEYCKDNGLKKQSDRISIAQWDRQQAAQATAAANKYKQEKETEERNLQFIRDDATIKANSGLPAKINNPDTRIAHTVDVDLPKIKGVVPKMSEATEIYTMAGAGTSTPIRDLRRLYTSYPEYGDASGWAKKSGTVYAKHHHYVVHWYENTKGVPETEIKLKGAK